MAEDPGDEESIDAEYSLADVPLEVFICDIGHDDGWWHWRMDTRPLVDCEARKPRRFGRRQRSSTASAHVHEIEVRDGTPPARAVRALAHCSHRCAMLELGPAREELTTQLASLHRVVWAMVDLVAIRASIDRRCNQMPARPELAALIEQRRRGDAVLEAMAARFEALVGVCDELADTGGSAPPDESSEALLSQAVRAAGAGRAAEEILDDVRLHVTSLDEALMEVSEAGK